MNYKKISVNQIVRIIPLPFLWIYLTMAKTIADDCNLFSYNEL